MEIRILPVKLLPRQPLFSKWTPSFFSAAEIASNELLRSPLQAGVLQKTPRLAPILPGTVGLLMHREPQLCQQP